MVVLGEERNIVVDQALERAEAHMMSLYKEFADLELHIKAGSTQNALNSLKYLKQDLASMGKNIITIYSKGFDSTADTTRKNYPNLTLFQKKEQ